LGCNERFQFFVVEEKIFLLLDESGILLMGNHFADEAGKLLSSGKMCNSLIIVLISIVILEFC
jgi:hypothetical protein